MDEWYFRQTTAEEVGSLYEGTEARKEIQVSNWIQDLIQIMKIIVSHAELFWFYLKKI